MGLPGAGKTTLAQGLVADGYQRLNRDDAGGGLRDLLPALDRALASGATRIVLDNTYVSRKSRAEVVQAASERGVPVRCIWLSTTVEDAQVNAAWRLLSRYGRLPGDDELAALQKAGRRRVSADGAVPLSARTRAAGCIRRVSRESTWPPFERRIDPAHVHRAVIVWCDDVLFRSRSGARTPASPDDMVVDEDRAATLRRYHDDGWRVLGLSWQPEIAAGTRSVGRSECASSRD